MGKFIKLIVALVVLAIMTGCGGGSATATNDGTGTSDTALLQGMNTDVSGTTIYAPASGGGTPATASYAVNWLPQVPPGDWDHTLNCGPASLVMLESYYKGMTPSSARITELMDELKIIDSTYRPTDGNGAVTSVVQLSALAKRISFADAQTKSFSSLADLKHAVSTIGPCIVTFRTRQNISGALHFVVCTGYDANYMYINDPGRSGSQPASIRYNAAIGSAAFWDIFATTGKSAVFLKKQPGVSVVWSDYKTIYRFTDSQGGRHYSETTTSPAGYSYEKEAFVIRTSLKSGDQRPISSCDKQTDGILTATAADVTTLTTSGYSCRNLGYSVSSTEAPFPFPFNCSVKRYFYSPVTGMGGHLFTTGQDTTPAPAFNLESGDYFHAFSNLKCE